jgi:hypothetical protein
MLLGNGAGGGKSNRRRSRGLRGNFLALDGKDLPAGEIFIGQHRGALFDPRAAGALLARNISQALCGHHSRAEHHGHDEGRDSHRLP